jgi:signal transduction histidine kinase
MHQERAVENAGGTQAYGGTSRLQSIVGISASVYLFWWFSVELLLPGSFNPLPGRLLVVAVAFVLFAASYRNRWVERRLSSLFTGWVCLLVGHYCYLIVGNRGDSTWWVGAFVTFAATSMCLRSPREVASFSVFAMGSVLYAAAALGQLRHSIYVPGLATILLLAYVTKRAEADVRRAREAAEAANGELEAFNYSVAHDLRTPLRAISGFSQVLLDDYIATLDATGQEHLKRVAAAAQQMGRLIDSMLSLSRVASATLDMKQIDLSGLVRETAERLRESEPERHVQFVIADGLSEQGDGVLLGAAIENLLSNAWKFTRNRTDARIEFGATKERGQTAYFVRDNGAGFDMAYASKLFGAFQRLHTASEFEGTGVGLATVHRIVRRHGGRVWAEGKVGEGACFHFTIGKRAGLS